MLLASLEYPKATRNDLMAVVGLGSAKVTGFHRWMNMTGFRNPRIGEITDLGRAVAEWDPYLQLPGTQWLLHARICSNPHAEVWFQITNGLLPHHSELTIAEAEHYLLGLDIGKDNRATLRKDIHLFFRSYTDPDALCRLGFLTLSSSGTYRRGNRSQIDPLVLASTMYRKNELGLATSTTSMSSLLTENGSVGRLFLLSEAGLLQSLRQLEVRGFVRISRIADLNNIAYTFEGNSVDILRMYYEEGHK